MFAKKGFDSKNALFSDSFLVNKALVKAVIIAVIDVDVAVHVVGKLFSQHYVIIYGSAISK
jgi:hypothetical protein